MRVGFANLTNAYSLGSPRKSKRFTIVDPFYLQLFSYEFDLEGRFPESW